MVLARGGAPRSRPIAGRWARSLPWSHAEVVANRLGLYGPRETLVTACSSGAAALAVGSDLIATGMADLVLAGGADAMTRICYLGFNALKLLDPEPCRPFDRGAPRHVDRGGRRHSSCWRAPSTPACAGRASMPSWRATA